MEKKTALELVTGVVVIGLLIWLLVWFFQQDS